MDSNVAVKINSNVLSRARGTHHITPPGPFPLTINSTQKIWKKCCRLAGLIHSLTWLSVVHSWPPCPGRVVAAVRAARTPGPGGPGPLLPRVCRRHSHSNHLSAVRCYVLAPILFVVTLHSENVLSVIFMGLELKLLVLCAQSVRF